MWGPCPILSPTRFHYFITFVDDYSRTTWLYLMKNRSELFSHCRAFCTEIKTQFHTSVQNLRSDNAKEYMSEQFPSFMLQNGILHQTSCVILLKMELLKEKIGIFLKLLRLYYFNACAQAFLGQCFFHCLFFN